MDSDIFVLIQEKYNELKSTIQGSTVIHDAGFEVKHAFHIGHRLDMGKKAIFAQVRVCTNRETGLRRAIKSYSLANCAESSNDIIFTQKQGLKLSLILNEIRIQSQLEHPNLCRLYEVFLEAKFIHLVLDYCKGGEVYDYLQTSHVFTVGEAFPLFIQLIEAVDYMNNKDIAHRGLCIENIMFFDKERTKVKIISFSSAAQGRRYSEKYGCALYMAPEMFSGNYDNRCDVWSLGVCFYTMIVGHQPFQAKTVSEIIKKLKSAKLPKTNAWKKVPKKTKTFLKSLLVKENMRPFANEILNSEFFVQHNKVIHELILANTIKALKTPNSNEEFMVKVQFANKIKKFLVKILTAKLLIPDLHHFEKVWKSLDNENLGFVTIQAFESFLNKKCEDPANLQKKFFELFRRFDSSKNNTIIHDDYLATICIISDRSIILEGFGVLDFDKDLLIQATDFARECEINNFEDFEVVFNETMGKESITKDEFVNLIVKFSS